jgi:hypothetical protein
VHWTSRRWAQTKRLRCGFSKWLDIHFGNHHFHH